jgi:aminoglycoside phosphotransferase (APT) family kinase protein
MVAMGREGITATVVSRLVASQFPQWADLPIVPVALNGWDNTTFRLGDELSVRLPSDDVYVAQVEKEHRWLPDLGPLLPLRIPEPVALGQPADSFPRPWSIYRWIDGEPASLGRIDDLTGFAADLARFLGALHTIDGTGGPAPGPHNFFRGGPLRVYDPQTRASIELLAGELDVVAVSEVWDAALASRWDQPPVWVQGDMAASNLIVANGMLRAVIDFGCSAVGDPACDLVIAWTFFAGESRQAFLRDLPLDDTTWARARGWALWKALITLAEDKLGDGHATAAAAAHRFGWRIESRDVIEVVTADHRDLAG